jgi:outer membrane protein assembly factor BamB
MPSSSLINALLNRLALNCCTLPSLLLFTCLLSLHAAESKWWPQFRGPEGRGIAEYSAPVIFGPDTNLQWKTKIPTGASSPIIWKNRIFLTGFDGEKLETFCLDRGTGTILWRKPAPTQKIELSHPTGSKASPTPITDGERIYVYFGSFGVLVYDFSGEEKWRLPMEIPGVEFGASASPILADGKLIILCDQDLGSFVEALDPANGKLIWKTERPEFRRSFASPYFWKHGADSELVVPGSIWLTSYNISNGAKLWSYQGTSRVACSSPTGSDGMLFSASWNTGGDPADRVTMPTFEEFAEIHDEDKDGQIAQKEIPKGPIRERFTQMDLDKNGFATHEEWELMRDMFAKAENALLAFPPGMKGEVAQPAWKSKRSLPYVSSPLYYKGRLYTIKNGGLASCYDAESGKTFYQDERIGASGDYYSSAVAAADKIYIASQQGIVVVFEAGDELKILERNRIPEQIFASPAIVDGKLYLRTTEALYAFAEQ